MYFSYDDSEKIKWGLLIFVMLVIAWIVLPVLFPSNLGAGKECSENEQCVSKECINNSEGKKVCANSQLGEKCKYSTDCEGSYCIAGTCSLAPSVGERCEKYVPLPENTKCTEGIVVQNEWYCPATTKFFNWIIGALVASIIAIWWGLAGQKAGGNGKYWVTGLGVFILSIAAIVAHLLGC